MQSGCFSDANAVREGSPHGGYYTFVQSRPAEALSLRPGPGKPGAGPFEKARAAEADG